MFQDPKRSASKSDRTPLWPSIALTGVLIHWGRMMWEGSVPGTWSSVDRVFDLVVVLTPIVIRMPGFWVMGIMTALALYELGVLSRRLFLWLLPGKGSLTKGSLAKVELS